MPAKTSAANDHALIILIGVRFSITLDKVLNFFTLIKVLFDRTLKNLVDRN